ncbi:MAG: FG-GAP repeat domain-containing protein, partial [Pirellula sp.]
MSSPKNQPSKRDIQRRRAQLPERTQVESTETEDDSVIGKMFWRSLGLIAGLALIGAVVYSATRPAKQEFVERKTETALPQERKAATVEVPQIPFTDITEQAGIRFSHYDGKQGERLLPETMGGGSGFLDYDNDGDQDILFVNSCDWPWSKPPEGKPAPTMCLYQNDGQGNFKDVTQEAGLAVTFYGMGPAFGDYDNDGWVDVFITAVGKNHLFHNQQGKFVEVTDAAGVG